MIGWLGCNVKYIFLKFFLEIKKLSILLKFNIKDLWNGSVGIGFRII